MASRRNANARGGGAGSRKRPVNVNENSPVIKAFRGYQSELDCKHDRHERIVKLSRDITIESKRAIFLLQRCAGDNCGEKEKILQEAHGKLKEIQLTRFLPVALELEGQDHYQFIRAYSPGLQEYIEAASFYHYLSHGKLVTLSEVESNLTFPRPAAAAAPVPQHAAVTTEAEQVGTGVSSTSNTCNATDVHTAGEKQEKEGSKRPSPHASEVSSTSDTSGGDNHLNCGSAGGDQVFVTVPPMEFMLGIADLTGELMRTAIMSVSAGNLDYPIRICEFMRVIHDSFMSYGNTARELSRKMATLRQSLQKVESACYTLKVRGSEIPKHMLADIFSSAPLEEAFGEDTEISVYD